MVQSGNLAIDSVTEKPLLDAIVWSWHGALSGVYPHADQNGKPFDGRRSRLAGTELAGGCKLIVVQWAADWKYTVEAFRFETYYGARESICHLCAATTSGPNRFTDFTFTSPCFEQPRRNDDYVNSEAAIRSPLSKLRGFHITMVLPELMHSGPLGVHLRAAGSVLWELCDEGVYAHGETSAHDWKAKLGLQLSCAYAQLRSYNKRHHVSCSQPRFTVARLSMRTRGCTPLLKAKAFNTLCVVDWLANVCSQQAAAAQHIEYFMDRAMMLWGLSAFFKIIRESLKHGIWMSSAELRELRLARNAFFGFYYKLHMLAEEDERPLYGFQPKHHMIDHAERIAQSLRLNPASCWTFQDEDNMHVMMKASITCRGSILEKAALEKWLLQFYSGL